MVPATQKSLPEFSLHHSNGSFCREVMSVSSHCTENAPPEFSPGYTETFWELSVYS
jgi:hypothetical protein